MRTSETTSAVFDAIVKAQAVLPAVTKDKRANAGSYSYTYASLDTVIDHAHGALVEHGLAIVQETVNGADGYVGVSTRLVHRSGEWVEYGPLFLPGGKDAQSYGSAISYARRYALSAALGLATEDDDDGKAASKKERKASGDGGRSAVADGRQASPPDTSGGGEGRVAVDGEAAGAEPSPPTGEPATDALWAEANRRGVTAKKAMAIAQGLGIEAKTAAELSEAELDSVLTAVPS